jgi:hypothetical protein
VIFTKARARGGLATKAVRRVLGTGEIAIDSYPHEARWALYPTRVDGLPAFAEMIRIMTADSCILRGQPAPWVPPGSYAPRRLDETILDRPSDLIVCDVDELREAAGVDVVADPAEAAAYAHSKLPDCFADASYVWAASSSAGFKSGLVKMKLVFQADQPITGERLGEYCKGVNRRAGFKLLDSAVASASQPIYFAPPLFEGVDDPLRERRVGFYQGLGDRVALDLDACPPPPAAGGGACGAGWRGHLEAIGGPDGFHGPIKRTICADVAEAGGIPSDLEDLLAAVAERVRRADPGHRGRHEIDRYASRRHLAEIARWAGQRQAMEAAEADELRRRTFRSTR